MKKLLLDVTYTDSTDKFWMDSVVKKTIVVLPDGMNIHKFIKEICEERDYVTFSYKGKPQSNIFVDTEENTSKLIGYVYRCKSEIERRTALFDVWVTIKEVIDFPIEEIC